MRLTPSQGCAQFKLDEAKVRLWNMFQATAELMSEGSKTLEDLRLVPAQRILFEVQLSDGTWPRTNKADEKKKVRLACSRCTPLLTPRCTGPPQPHVRL